MVSNLKYFHNGEVLGKLSCYSTTLIISRIYIRVLSKDDVDNS